MRRGYTLDNADIVLSLLRAGYAHACERCERGMHVRYASGLCVSCYNELRQAARETSEEPRLSRKVTRRRVSRRTAPPPSPAPQS